MHADLLRDRPVRLLLLARASSLVGTAAAPVGLAFAVLQATGSTADLGLVLTARFVPVVLLLLVGGVLGDRVRRRERVLLACDAAAGAAQGLTALLVLTGEARLLPLCALQAVSGGVTAFAHPAFTGLLPELVAEERRQRVNGALGAVRETATLVGAPLGGALAAVAGPGWALVLDAASYALSASCWAGLARHRPAPAAAEVPPAREGVWREAREGLQAARALPWFVAVVLQFTVVVGAGEASYLVLGPVVARDAYGGPGAYGVLLAVEAGGSVVGALVAGRARWRHPLRVGVAGTVTYPLVLLLLAVRAPLPAVLVASAVLGACFGALVAVWTTALQVHVPDRLRSRVNALDLLGSVVALPVGTALLGALAERTGTEAALLLAAGLSLAACVGALLVRAVRDLPGLPAAGPPGPPAPSEVPPPGPSAASPPAGAAATPAAAAAGAPAR